MNTEIRNGLLRGRQDRGAKEDRYWPRHQHVWNCQRVEGRQEVLNKNTSQGSWGPSNPGGRGTPRRLSWQNMCV